jgi:TrmH family RNA methyltransferase
MSEIITSKDNRKIKELVSLYDNNTRKEKGLFVIEGFHLLEMALKENYVLSIFTLKEIENISDSINQYIINEDILKKISKATNPQGVVAICRMIEPSPIDGNAIYLDDVNDPGNMGTILRSALAFGFRNVILSQHCVSIYNEKSISASQGAIFGLNIVNDDSLLLNYLKNSGYKIYATSLDNSINIEEITPQDPYVLVFGNEAHGVCQKIMDIADTKIKLVINGIDSLNVAIAASICMYLFKK